MVTTALLPGAGVLESGVITHDLLLLSFSWLLTHTTSTSITARLLLQLQTIQFPWS